jgi:DNA-binding SARP family transcriptional activator
LYREDFLEGLSVRQALGFEEWVLSERERLRQMAIRALQCLSEAYSVRGEYAAGIEYTNRLLVLEPWQEEARRLAQPLGDTDKPVNLSINTPFIKTDM